MLYSKIFITNIVLLNAEALFKFNLILIGFVLVYLLNILIFNKFTIKFFTITFSICNSISLYFISKFSIRLNHEAISNLFGTNFVEALEFINIKFLLYILLAGLIPAIFFLKFFSLQENDSFFKTLKAKIIKILILFFIILFLG